MTKHKFIALIAASTVALVGCSGGTTVTTEDVEEPADEDDATDGDSADQNSRLNDDERMVLEGLEENMRSSAAESYYELRSFNMRPAGTNRFEGRTALYDPLLDRVTESDCFAEISGEQIVDSGCTEVDPVAARQRSNRGDVVIRATDRGEMREEIIREMQHNVAGQGRTNTPTSFSGEFPTFISLYRTTSADGGQSWQSGCAGRLEEGENGTRVASFVCRQRP